MFVTIALFLDTTNLKLISSFFSKSVLLKKYLISHLHNEQYFAGVVSLWHQVPCDVRADGRSDKGLMVFTQLPWLPNSSALFNKWLILQTVLPETNTVLLLMAELYCKA